MAIIACRECGHQVSDQAASCPNCGAPLAAASKPRPRGRRIIAGVLLTFASLWLIGATLWLIEIHSAPGRLAGMFGSPAPPAGRTATADRSAAAERAAGEPEVAPRAVYQTTAEQLYEDYDANEVATQSKIGNSRIRVTGSITEIDEDALDHPIVKLWTSGEHGVALTLTGDQRAAAAQLSKGLTVDIQCDRMQRAAGSPQGSRCALLLVDDGSAAPPLRTRETAPTTPAAQVSVPCTPAAAAPAAPAVSTVPASATASARTRHRAAPAARPTSAEGPDIVRGTSPQPLSLPMIAVAPADPATMPPFNASVPPLSAVTAAAVSPPAAPAATATSAAAALKAGAEPAATAAVALTQSGDAAAAHLAAASTAGSTALHGTAIAGDELAAVRASAERSVGTDPPSRSPASRPTMTNRAIDKTIGQSS